MNTALKRISLGMSTAIAATSLALILAPAPASATPALVKLYPFTTSGGQRCNADANAAGPGYYCDTRKVGGVKHYALIRA
ncbi:hypothetical protein [Nonomuraea wenchangensis]|uniref:Uncharacterized protein n=1 Tax=Nonomuraea wenchangensis TaxID=568860 RepID=A0A1I0KRY3_9ACTN|nr:hypothetical protein [Nonomuraea wenchangensis]SEU27734.1 hypothetical protein SAMN05421811_10971 [Nonomuraea wenchangensis]